MKLLNVVYLSTYIFVSNLSLKRQKFEQWVLGKLYLFPINEDK